MKNLKEYLKLDDSELRRLEEIYEKYRKFYTDPENCEPAFIINTPLKNQPTQAECIADPLVMLRTELDKIKAHIEVGDDCVPAVRVNFGTAQVAAAFGCELHVFRDSSPAAKTHVLKNAEDVYKLEKPSLDAGWYGKLKEFTEIWLENLPEGIHIQHPDIQSPFNSAYLIRGNDIFMDFYDDPEALEALLDLVTDYMIDLVPYLKQMVSTDNEYFFDWGAMWRGTARISNCSTHMISPQMYKEYVFPRDMRLLEAIGRGRVHYCGTYREVIDEFFKNPNVTGLDTDATHHDLWDLASNAPANLTLLQWADPPEGIHSTLEKLMRGQWPKKRNIIIQANASSVEEGRELLGKLRNSVRI